MASLNSNETYLTYDEYCIKHLITHQIKQKEILKKLIQNNIQKQYLFNELTFNIDLQELQQKKLLNKIIKNGFQQKDMLHDLYTVQRENSNLLQQYNDSNKKTSSHTKQYYVVFLIVFILYLFLFLFL